MEKFPSMYFVSSKCFSYLKLLTVKYYTSTPRPVTSCTVIIFAQVCRHVVIVAYVYVDYSRLKKANVYHYRYRWRGRLCL